MDSLKRAAEISIVVFRKELDGRNRQSEKEDALSSVK